MTRSATRLSFSTSATLEPPYFWTMTGTASLCPELRALGLGAMMDRIIRLSHRQERQGAVRLPFPIHQTREAHETSHTRSVIRRDRGARRPVVGAAADAR